MGQGTKQKNKFRDLTKANTISQPDSIQKSNFDGYEADGRTGRTVSSPHAVTYYHLTILSVSSSSSISNRHSILTKMSEKKKRPITTMKIEGNFALMSLAIPRCVLFYFYPLTHIVDRMLFAYICLLHTAPCAASFFCCVCSSVRSYLST